MTADMASAAVAPQVAPRPRPVRLSWLPHWSLTWQFLVAHFALVLIGVLITGAWIGTQIEASVLDRTASVTALYVDSVIGPRLQNLAQAHWLSADEIADLDHLIAGTALG